jgi:hypothetical protein
MDLLAGQAIHSLEHGGMDPEIQVAKPPNSQDLFLANFSDKYHGIYLS